MEEIKLTRTGKIKWSVERKAKGDAFRQFAELVKNKVTYQMHYVLSTKKIGQLYSTNVRIVWKSV